ncbi:hypothetical protein, partial [Phocaeicola sartorii]|uniref:hypothetical protein n=1 Tax=Phocaeicola sartorii TaxID=671267 RepID=UPI00272D61C6
AAAKNIRTFFKRTGIFLENGLILFRKDKDVRAGEERTYHYISGESRAHPEAPLKTLGREKTEKNFLVQVHANKSLYIKPVKKITYLPRSLLPHIHI